MIFRIMPATIGAFLLLVGLPIALHGVFVDSDNPILWDIYWAAGENMV